jgi:hypothetical protein
MNLNSRKDRRGYRSNRSAKAPNKLQRLIAAARSPFERRCLLKWSYLTRERAERRMTRAERAILCRYCGNWHLVPKVRR